MSKWTGQVAFAYAGSTVAAGGDTVQASAVLNGVLAVSNEVSVPCADSGA